MDGHFKLRHFIDGHFKDGHFIDGHSRGGHFIDGHFIDGHFREKPFQIYCIIYHQLFSYTKLSDLYFML